MRILVGLRRALPQRAHGSCIPNRGGWGIVLAVILGLKHWIWFVGWEEGEQLVVVVGRATCCGWLFHVREKAEGMWGCRTEDPITSCTF